MDIIAYNRWLIIRSVQITQIIIHLVIKNRTGYLVTNILAMLSNCVNIREMDGMHEKPDASISFVQN